MHGYGRERVIRSLLSYSCSLTAKAVLATIHERIKENSEKEISLLYIAECARMTSENTAKVGIGPYMTAKLSDILHPKPVDNRTGEEIVADVIKTVGIEVI